MNFNPDRKLKVCEICLVLTDKPTEEHAYPRWLRRKINAFYSQLPPGIHPVKGWEQTSKTVLKPVCRDCQQRLNHNFENRARDLLKAMLDDLALELSPTQQVVLAAWFAKTAIVLTLVKFPPANPDPAAAGRRERARITLHTMLTTLQPPRDMIQRLAHTAWRAPDTLARLVPAEWADVKPYDSNPVILLPHMLFEQQTGVEAPVAAFIDATKNDDRFLTLWPQPQEPTPVVWPPLVSVSVADSQRLLDEWQHRPAAMNPYVFRAVVEDPPSGTA